MARAFEQLSHLAAFADLSFEERLSQLLQAELAFRAQQRLTQRLRWARSFLPEGMFGEALFFAKPSLDGGLLELWLSLDKRPSSSDTRADKRFT